MSEPACWLWVTRPEYYLDADGQDLPALEPDTGFVPDGWWTCDPRTKSGDLVLLYRAEARRDVSHFLVARSGAELLDKPDSEFHGEHTCQYEVLARFDRSLSFAELASDPVLQDWHPVKIRMHQRSFPVPAPAWHRLGELLGADFPGLAAKARDGLERIRRERQIEERLLGKPHLLAGVGLRGLSRPRRQCHLPCGRIADLVYQQGRGVFSRTVVVELKKIKAGPAAVRQVVTYRELLNSQRRWWQRGTLAVLISDDATANAIQLATTQRVRLISLSQLNIASIGPAQS